jgi:hypothetical protein
MEPKCEFFEARLNAKAFMESKLAQAGEGVNHPQVRAFNRKSRVKANAANKKECIEQTRRKKRDAGIILCDEKCSKTGRYCTAMFLHESSHEVHIKKRSHAFRRGIRARDLIVIAASKPGGLVSCGSRPDRQSHFVFECVNSAEEGAKGEKDAWCFGKFNRKEGQTPYRKPARLLEVLRELFDIEPKLNAKAMRDRMKAMRDEAGGLLFCWSKRHTTGMLLTEDQIQSWINTETQRRKKGSKVRSTDKDLEESRLVAEQSAL